MCSRQLEPRRHQQRRPVDRVEAQDVLPDHVVARGPERRRQVPCGLRGDVGGRGGIRERGVVVQKRVEPHVEDVLGIPRHLHTPREPVARERNVAQPRADEGERLVVARARRDEVGALGVEPLERLLEVRELEEVRVLALARELDVVNRARVAGIDLALRLEVRAAWAVPPLVGALVDEAVLAHLREHLLHHRFVLRVGGADEEVVRRLEQWRQRLEALGIAVGEHLGLDPRARGPRPRPARRARRCRSGRTRPRRADGGGAPSRRLRSSCTHAPDAAPRLRNRSGW